HLPQRAEEGRLRPMATEDPIAWAPRGQPVRLGAKEGGHLPSGTGRPLAQLPGVVRLGGAEESAPRPARGRRARARRT
ncbi:unnamed protein product, partial [Prorocentrum cordatum]